MKLEMEIHKAYLGEILITDMSIVHFKYGQKIEEVKMKKELAELLYDLVYGRNG